VRPSSEIVVAWLGLPVYGARELKRVLNRYGSRISIVATDGPFARERIESELGSRAVWIEPDSPCTWDDLGISPPQVFVQTGWAYPAFNSLGAAVKSRGGRVVLMADNSDKRTLRQWLGRIVYRVRYRRFFDAALVPGQSAARLLRSLGADPSRIFTGLYGADSEIFAPGPPLLQRPKRILFVGALIERKAPELLLAAYGNLRRRDPAWRLTFIGDGPLAEKLRADGVDVLPFSDPAEIAAQMRASRVFVLPSVEDHWGLVVHEAALSGCALVVSDGVGAREDLVTPENGFVFRRRDCASLEAALSSVASWDEDALQGCYSASLAVAAEFGPQRFERAFASVLKAIGESS
jgi:glycosyltransferase involved in cell wall biosynthesis